MLERSLENEMEVLEVGLPAALSVTTDINQPRLPGMKEILKAGKKPVVEWSLADLGINSPVENKVEVVQTRAPHRVQRKQAKIGGTAQEAAQGLVDALVKEGLI